MASRTVAHERMSLTLILDLVQPSTNRTALTISITALFASMYFLKLLTSSDVLLPLIKKLLILFVTWHRCIWFNIFRITSHNCSPCVHLTEKNDQESSGLLTSRGDAFNAFVPSIWRFRASMNSVLSSSKISLCERNDHVKTWPDKES